MTDEFKTITGFGKPAMTEWEWQQKLADDENKRPGKLNQFDKIDCPKCLNGAEPKLDIRTWQGEKMLKGITLNQQEATELLKILQGMGL